MSTKSVNIALLVLGGLLLVNVGWLWMTDTKIKRAVSTAPHLPPVPYTLTIRERVLDSSGISHLVAEYTVAVRVDGSYLIWTESDSANVPNRQVSRRVMTILPDARIETDDLRQLKSTTHVRQRPFAVRSPELGCALPLAGRESVVGHDDRILGYRVERVTDWAGGVAWYAPDLGCAELRTRTPVRDQVSIKEATAVIPGDPDPTLFDAMAYREVPPSVLRGITDVRRAATIDRQYHATHGQVR